MNDDISIDIEENKDDYQNTNLNLRKILLLLKSPPIDRVSSSPNLACYRNLTIWVIVPHFSLPFGEAYGLFPEINEINSSFWSSIHLNPVIIFDPYETAG
jgi:hypothetical protein